MGRCQRCGLVKTGATGALADAHHSLELARKTTHAGDLAHFLAAADKQLERARAELEREAAALRAELQKLRPAPPHQRAPRRHTPAPAAPVRAPFPEELRILARSLRINRPFRRPPGPDPIWSYRPVRDPAPWSVPPPEGGDLFALAHHPPEEHHPPKRPVFLRERAPGHDGWCSCRECLEWLEGRPAIH
jgi:hypothetical protein